MNTIRTIKLHSQEIKKDKQTFIASSSEINGKWFKVKFTKECEKAPKRKGLYKLTIDLDNCSLELGKPYKTESGKKGISTPIIWVREIKNIVAYTEDELKEMNRNTLCEAFGESKDVFYNEVNDDGKIPF